MKKLLAFLVILFSGSVILFAIIIKNKQISNDLLLLTRSTHDPYVLQNIEIANAKERAKTDTTVNTDIRLITAVSAISGGVGDSNDDSKNTSIIARGVCWSTTPEPTINNNHTINGNNYGSFYSVMTGLLPETEYFVRSYMTYDIRNKIETRYGPVVMFKTTNWYPQLGRVFSVVESATPNIIEIIYNYDISDRNFNKDGFVVKVKGYTVPIKSIEIKNNVIYLTIDKIITIDEEDIIVEYTSSPVSKEQYLSFSSFPVFNNMLE